jgi:hypothetical protein
MLKAVLLPADNLITDKLIGIFFFLLSVVHLITNKQNGELDLCLHLITNIWIKLNPSEKKMIYNIGRL